MVTFARTHSRYYQRLYQPLPAHLHHLADLPPVTKRELTQHFDEWITDSRVSYDDVSAYIADPTRVGVPYLGRYSIWRTSGTTGSPGVFLQDSHALAAYFALLIMRGYLTWLGVGRQFWRLVRRRWHATFIYATGGHFAAVAFSTLFHQMRYGRSQEPTVLSVHLPLHEIVRALNDDEPAILSTYPSVLEVLTEEQLSGRLRIRPLLIVSGGECMKPLLRKQITGAFGCKVRDMYAASEFMGIAYDCNHRRLHVNSDWVILEPVTADYEPLTDDSMPYSVLLTNLANRVQPLLRYDLGDSVQFYSTPCPCGSPLPSITVEGRDDEILNFETNEGRRVAVMPMPLSALVLVVPGVDRFQLVQTGAHRLSVRLDVVRGADPESVWRHAVDALREYLNAQGLLNVQLERSAELPCQNAVSGKFRHVWSEWRPIPH